MIDSSAFREAPFVVALFVQLLAFMGLYIPYFYIQVFAEQKKVLSADRSWLYQYLIVFMNVGSFFGRLVSGLTAYIYVSADSA